MIAVTLAPAGQADYADCRRIVNQGLNREGFGFLMRSVFDDYATRSLQDARYVLHVLRVQGDIVGFIRALHRLDGQTTLHEICVDSSCHGQGYGKIMVSYLRQEATSRGQHTLLVKTPQGIPANNFYAALGFRLSHTEQARVRTVNVYTCFL